MQSTDKKLTNEDTWRPAELSRHMHDAGRGEEQKSPRRRDENERRPRAGESVERRRRDPKPEYNSYGGRREMEPGPDTTKERSKGGREERDRVRRREEQQEERYRVKVREEKEERYREKRRVEKEEIDREKKRVEKEKIDREKRRDDKYGEKEERDREKRRDERHSQKRREERDSQKRKDERDRERREDQEGRPREMRTGEGAPRERRTGEGVPRDRRTREEAPRERRTGEEVPSERRTGEGAPRERRTGEEAPRERRTGEGVPRDRRTREEAPRERRTGEEVPSERRTGEGAPRERRTGEEAPIERRTGEEAPRGGDTQRDKAGRKDGGAEREEGKERGTLGDGGSSRRRWKDQVLQDGGETHVAGQHPGHKEERAYKEGRRKEKVDKGSQHKEDKRRHDRNPKYADGHLPDGGPSVEPGGGHTSPHRGLQDKTDKAPAEVGSDGQLSAEYGNEDYEDDFEDYDEDFEDLDESEGEEKQEELSPHVMREVSAIRRAMEEENERVRAAQGRGSAKEEPLRWSPGPVETQTKDPQRGKFIDFVAAKQRDVSKSAASRQKKRSAELLRLIDLDFSRTVCLLDLPPVTGYDLYIKSFGSANTKQAYVQCKEDRGDRDVQTEEIEACEKWTQHPAEMGGACGDPGLSQSAQDRNSVDMKLDSQRLLRFLHSASQVMMVLMEENQAEERSLGKLGTQNDNLSFSDSSSLFNTNLPFLIGRPVLNLLAPPAQRRSLASVHGPVATSSALWLDGLALVCIWNIWEPSQPQKVLVYESEVRCGCFGPGKASLVIAGTAAGSVVLWDLREPASDHRSLRIGDDEWAFRQPTFSTAAVVLSQGHVAPISSVEVLPASTAEGLGSEVSVFTSEEGAIGSSFQLASLDENGILNFWVVMELPKANDAGSQTDLGLRPGGRVKLLHSSSVNTADSSLPGDTVAAGLLRPLVFQFLPTDSSHLFLGTNMGLVDHRTSHGLKALPRFYGPRGGGRCHANVSSIHFSPFRPQLFLVGCSDGSVRLHRVTYQRALAEWRCPGPVLAVRWAPTRPATFCALDAAAGLHLWDLLLSDLRPIVTETLHLADRVTAMSVFGDSGQQNTFSGIALAYQSGKMAVHYFTRRFTVPQLDEEEKLENLINQAF